MNRLKPAKRVVSPRTLRKSSQRMQGYSPVKVAGKRELTETGYRVYGYRGKTFETFFETMLAGSASAMYVHDKKDKSLWILSGQGFVTTETEKGEQETRRIIPGDHIRIERGTICRVTTTATSQLEFFVAQSAKYEKTFRIVAPSDAVKAASESDLVEPSLNERLGISTSITRRRRSKAAQQQQAGRRKVSPQVEETFTVLPADIAQDPRGTGSSGSQMNPKPSGGHFSEAGAG